MCSQATRPYLAGFFPQNGRIVRVYVYISTCIYILLYICIMYMYICIYIIHCIHILHMYQYPIYTYIQPNILGLLCESIKINIQKYRVEILCESIKINIQEYREI